MPPQGFLVGRWHNLTCIDLVRGIHQVRSFHAHFYMSLWDQSGSLNMLVSMTKVIPKLNEFGLKIEQKCLNGMVHGKQLCSPIDRYGSTTLQRSQRRTVT